MNQSPYMRALAILGLTFCLAPVVAWAGEDGLAECATVRDDAPRLACYDRIARRASPESKGNAIQAATTKSAADFGLSQKAIRERDPTNSSDTELSSIDGTVTSVRLDHLGRFIVTLANGQVWAQTEAKGSAYLRPGETVTISKSSMGSFKLATPRRASTRVRRLQ